MALSMCGDKDKGDARVCVETASIRYCTARGGGESEEHTMTETAGVDNLIDHGQEENRKTYLKRYPFSTDEWRERERVR